MAEENVKIPFTSRGSLSYDEFTDKMNELIRLKWGDPKDFVEEDEDKPPMFIMEEPTANEPTELYLPLITFDVFERIRSKSHKSLDPIFFGTYPDADDPHTIIKLYRMWFDIEMEFKIHHYTNRESAILMEEFEDFLFEYKGYFKEIGLSEMIFLAETKPQVVTKWQRVIPVRTLRYLVRIERITTIRSNKLKELATPGMNGVLSRVEDTPIMHNYKSQLRIED